MSIVSCCRLCGSRSLTPVFSLGEMAFSGIFPNFKSEKVPTGELTVLLCGDCALAQLDRNFPSDEMYGSNYGYMSSLNASMVNHLQKIVKHLENITQLKEGEIVLDVGSNDGTMLLLYQTPGIVRVGMDPTIIKYKDLYPPQIIGVPEFFSASTFSAICPGGKAKVVSTVAMLYDLPNPKGFAQEVREVLANDGIWFIEVSYGPWMLKSGAFDAVCHEHIEYYSLWTLKKILDEAGLKIINVSFNDTNGGSISITSTPFENQLLSADTEGVKSILNEESQSGCNELSGWNSFAQLAKNRVLELERFLISVKADGKRIVALGASTKGNVLLQSLSPEALSAIEVIGEVNEFKYGKVTPGTLIKIAPETEVLETKPDFVLILPWHFKDSFKSRLADFVRNGGRLVFPLPKLEVIESIND